MIGKIHFRMTQNDLRISIESVFNTRIRLVWTINIKNHWSYIRNHQYRQHISQLLKCFFHSKHDLFWFSVVSFYLIWFNRSSSRERLIIISIWFLVEILHHLWLQKMKMNYCLWMNMNPKLWKVWNPMKWCLWLERQVQANQLKFLSFCIKMGLIERWMWWIGFWRREEWPLVNLDVLLQRIWLDEYVKKCIWLWEKRLDIPFGESEECCLIVRFDDTWCDETVIKYITDGCLVRECIRFGRSVEIFECVGWEKGMDV